MLYLSGDGVTYNTEKILPLEYESKEKAEHDFLCEVEKAKKEHNVVKFLNEEFYINDYFFIENNKEVYYGPQFFTLEEWFEKCKINPKNKKEN